MNETVTVWFASALDRSFAQFVTVPYVVMLRHDSFNLIRFSYTRGGDVPAEDARREREKE